MTTSELRAYLAGVYDATAADTILAQFTPDYRKRMIAVLTCYSTKAKGKLDTFDDWAYGQVSGAQDQACSAAGNLNAVCLQESGLAPAPK